VIGRRTAALLLGGLVALGAGAAVVHYELTPTPVLGYADPHATGASRWVQKVVAGSDGVIAAIPGTAGSTATAPPAPAQVAEPVKRSGLCTELPTLQIALPIRAGDGSDNFPLWSAFVYPGTAWPGQPGNSYVYAHGYWGMFGGLLYAQPGDAAYLHDYVTGAVQALHVSRVVGKIAYNDDRWLLAQTTAPMVTLQTCMDYDPKGPRYIVQLVASA